jgi:Spy/CpxP family protein refolding chaperone
MLPTPTRIATIALAISLHGAAHAQRAAPQPAQPYAGQQSRAVTSLSAEDISQLLAGGGWGLAKPAELNGYPGPAHVLELADKLALTRDQRTRVERIFKRMQARAKSIGARYVSAEVAIDEVFRSGKAGSGGLETRLRDAERLRSELRRVHLQAHIETTPLLTEMQRKKYTELRGYGAHGGHHPQHKH